VFPETGVVDVQSEDEPGLSSYRNSELGLEDERVVTCPIWGGFAEILVVTLFFLTLTEHGGSEDFECFPMPTKGSAKFFGGGVISDGSALDCSINLVSHGLADIHRSNQLHPQLFLSNSLFLLREYTEELMREFESGVDLHC
jgi:hypothetical protein